VESGAMAFWRQSGKGGGGGALVVCLQRHSLARSLFFYLLSRVAASNRGRVHERGCVGCRARESASAASRRVLVAPLLRPQGR